MVDHEQHGELALLEVALHVGRAEPGGDVPVDGADVVARLVLAHLGELDPAAAERAGVLAGHDVAHEVAGGDLDPPHLARDLLRASWHRHRLEDPAAAPRPGPCPSASAR